MSQTSPSSGESPSSASSPNLSQPRQLEASKWLDFVFLASEKELGRLFEQLAPVTLYRSKGLFKKGEAEIGVADFLKEYQKYLTALITGDEGYNLDPFYLYITQEPTALFRKVLPDGREHAYTVLPTLIMQPGKIVYSPVDVSFRKSAFTEDPIRWGVKITFPQVYLDPQTRVLLRADRSPPSPNAPMLKILRQWVRDETFPVAFEVDGKRQQTEFRLGNELKDFKHVAMEKRGLFVSRAGSS